MKHDVIETNPRKWRTSAEVTGRFEPMPGAAERFAAACAAIPGARVLGDVVDRVALSFGALTDEVRDGLRARGWIFLRTIDRNGERVLDVSFTGNRRAESTAGELAADLALVVGEMEIAETRVW